MMDTEENIGDLMQISRPTYVEELVHIVISDKLIKVCFDSRVSHIKRVEFSFDHIEIR